MNEQDHHLSDARRQFAAFYAIATERDAHLMDSLVLGRVAIVRLFTTPREHLPGAIRRACDDATNKVEHLFTDCRETVRNSPTFRALPAQDRARIERELFSVQEALGG